VQKQKYHPDVFRGRLARLNGSICLRTELPTVVRNSQVRGFFLPVIVPDHKHLEARLTAELSPSFLGGCKVRIRPFRTIGGSTILVLPAN